MILEFIVVLVLGMILGAGSAWTFKRTRVVPSNLVEPATKPEEISESLEPSKPLRIDPAERFLLTHKRGRIVNDIALIAAEITRLRASNQPFEYYLDGRLVKKE